MILAVIPWGGDEAIDFGIQINRFEAFREAPSAGVSRVRDRRRGVGRG